MPQALTSMIGLKPRDPQGESIAWFEHNHIFGFAGVEKRPVLDQHAQQASIYWIDSFLSRDGLGLRYLKFPHNPEHTLDSIDGGIAI